MPSPDLMLNSFACDGRNFSIFSFPPIAFFVLQKGIEGGLEEIVVCGVVYSIQYTTFMRTVKSETGTGTACGQKCLSRRLWVRYLKFS